MTLRKDRNNPFCKQCGRSRSIKDATKRHPLWCRDCSLDQRRDYEFKKTGKIRRPNFKPVGNTKKCTRCKEDRLLSDYSPRQTPKKKVVPNSVCKSCILMAQQQNVKRPGVRERMRKSSRKYYHSPEGKIKSEDARLRREYGISLADKKAMIQENGGVCPICWNPDPGRFWVVDHCHKSGKVRGVICDKCNKMLGLANDSMVRLVSAMMYLTNHYLNRNPVEGIEGVPRPDDEYDEEYA
jgi:hypothetical protein